MGGGNYNYDLGRSSRSSVNTEELFSKNKKASIKKIKSNQYSLPTLLNVYGQDRVCDNDNAIVIAMDVTQSRGNDTKVIYDKLPKFISWLEMKGYLPNAALSFAAIGDATVDKAPLQISQWERDNRLDEALAQVWLEEGGGGTGQESYELAAYYYAYHTHLKANQEGRKGYFFFIGDEGFYDKVKPSEAKKFLGISMDKALDSKVVFDKLKQKFNVFFIYPKANWEQRKQDIDKEIQQRLKEANARFEDNDIRASLIWQTRDDLDIHMITPSGERIYYGHKQSRCGGELDVDRNVNGETTKPVENIRWKKGDAPAGKYQVIVQNYGFHERQKNPIPYKVEIDIQGHIQHFSGTMSLKGETKERSDQYVYEFNYNPDDYTADLSDDCYQAYHDDVILAQWQQVLGKEHILTIDDPNNIVETIVGAIGINTAKINLNDFKAQLSDDISADISHSLQDLEFLLIPTVDNF